MYLNLYISHNVSHFFIFVKAARDGKRELVERRLEKLGKGNKKINKKDQDNTTAMHYAVRYNHLHIVKLLLDYGAGEESGFDNHGMVI